MDLVAAFFAVGTALLAYFNFVIDRRVRAIGVTASLRHLLAKSVIATGVYCAATGVFVVFAAASSMVVLLFGGVSAVLVAGVSSMVFTIIRPRHQQPFPSKTSGVQMGTP